MTEIQRATNATRNRNDQGLAELAQRHVGLAFLICGDREVALDVVADVTLRILQRRADTDVENTEAFFHRCVVNRAIDLGRRYRRGSRISNPSPRHAEAADVADRAVAAVMVGDALKQLSPKLRAVIVLRFYDDLTDREISQMLEIPLGTVKSRLARAVDHLRRIARVEFPDTSEPIVR